MFTVMSMSAFRFFFAGILLLVGISASALSKEDKEFKKQIDLFRPLCVKERIRIDKKNKVTKEKPQDSCACMVRALESKHEIESVEAMIEEYKADDNDTSEPQSSDAALEFIGKIEENCIADSNWKMGTYEPENIEKKLDQMMPSEKSAAPAKKSSKKSK